MIASKCGWTPFHNEEVTGWPIITIVNGKEVMREDKLIGKPMGTPIEFFI